jgi:hypothetical protein
MKKIHIYVLGILLLFPLGCGTIKKMTGWGSSEENQSNDSTNVTTKVVPPPPSKKMQITSKTVTNWVLYSAITVAILLALRYGLKKITSKKE